MSNQSPHVVKNNVMMKRGQTLTRHGHIARMNVNVNNEFNYDNDPPPGPRGDEWDAGLRKGFGV